MKGEIMSEMEAVLLRRVKELEFLVSVLLGRSGLDAEGIVRAFDIARTSAEELDKEMAAVSSKAFLATPEGQEAHRFYAEQRRVREHKIWVEECREDGRIHPHPTVGTLTPKTPEEDI